MTSIILWGRSSQNKEIYCAQPHEEVCSFAAAAFEILTADFTGHEYNNVINDKRRYIAAVYRSALHRTAWT